MSVQLKDVRGIRNALKIKTSAPGPFFLGPAGKIVGMTNSAHRGNVGGRQCQTYTD